MALRLAPQQFDEVNELIRHVPDLDGGTSPGEWQMARRVVLDTYWRFYKCRNYDDRTIDWNGHQEVTGTEAAEIMREGAVPPGFIELTELPLKFRKPSVPTNLARAIIVKFTGLLFSAKRHPQILCDDPQTQAWLLAFAEKTAFWTIAAQIRNQGGARGTAVVVLKFINGTPVLETLDPAACKPIWKIRQTLELRALDHREQYSVTVFVKGKPEQRWFWRRRLIGEKTDTLWEKVPVTAYEPEWEAYAHKDTIHDFGFCPAVWIQNDPDEESIDGEPDCYGAFPMIEELDALMSQAGKGTKASCDPTLLLASDAEFDVVHKGSFNTIQVEKGGEGNYVEITGSGIERAQKLSKDIRDHVMVLTRCQLDLWQTGAATKSVSEVEFQYSAMTERADIFREQYGERGLKRILLMALSIARMYEQPQQMEIDGIPTMVRRTIDLPKRKMEYPDGTWEYVAHVPGRGEQITLKWPEYFTPPLSAVSTAVTAATAALSGRVVTHKDAVEFVAPYLGIEDPDATIKEVMTQGSPTDAVSDVLASMLRGTGPQT